MNECLECFVYQIRKRVQTFIWFLLKLVGLLYSCAVWKMLRFWRQALGNRQTGLVSLAPFPTFHISTSSNTCPLFSCCYLYNFNKYCCDENSRPNMYAWFSGRPFFHSIISVHHCACVGYLGNKCSMRMHWFLSCCQKDCLSHLLFGVVLYEFAILVHKENA